MPEYFQNDRNATNNCNFLTEEVLFPERQSQEYAHKPLYIIYEKAEIYLRRLFGRCKVGSGKYNNLVLYLYLLVIIINKFGTEGEAERISIKYILDHIVNQEDTTQYYFPKDSLFVFPERMKASAIELIKKAGRLLGALQGLKVTTYNNFLIRNGDREIRINRNILYALSKNMYVALELSSKIMNKLDLLYDTPNDNSDDASHSVTLEKVADGMVTIKNSWGPKWADHGYLTFPIDIIAEDTDYESEATCIEYTMPVTGGGMKHRTRRRQKIKNPLQVGPHT